MTIARAYYNEIDPFAAAWLRELIKAGEIMPGDVDERDIRDVVAEDLHGYTQCHFFAGIGVWSYALRCAGWPDDKPVWTGSCPCQPFSAAGKGGGFDDERHLWPAWHHLIRICRPPVVFGEQVASKDGLNWFDLVSSDMEGTGYAIGAADMCAAGVGAPHIRQRLWFVAERLADMPSERRHGREDTAGARGRHSPENGGATGGLADGIGPRLEGHAGHGDARHEPGRISSQQDRSAAAQSVVGRVADADRNGAERQSGDASETPGFSQAQRQPEHDADVFERGGADSDGRGSVRGNGISDHAERPGPVNSLWRDADWLFCRDGKWRPVEPGTFPLAYGAPARVGRLRGYGNAIPAPVAQAVIEAYQIEAVS